MLSVNIDFFSLLIFVHVVLFVYSIGGDIAVFYIGKYLTREDLSLDERLRVRDIRLMVDMSARTCLVLLLPVGFTLATAYNSPLTGPWLILFWGADFGWLWLVWVIHAKRGTPFGATLRTVDIWIRYGVAAGMIGFGAYSFLSDGPIYDGWLATKITLYGMVILNGIWIRSIIARWQGAYDLVRAGGDERVRGEQRMKKIQAASNRAAFSIWVLVMVMAFMGQVKPF
jgi:hypothetical protein